MGMALRENVNGEYYMKFYEQGRLYSFRDAKIGYHSNQDHLHAYNNWADAEPLRREHLWDVYCDIRDGYAIGTNAALRQKLKQQDGLNIETRYISKVE